MNRMHMLTSIAQSLERLLRFAKMPIGSVGLEHVKYKFNSLQSGHTFT